MQRGPVVSLGFPWCGNGLSTPDGKTPRFQTDIGTLAKHCRDPLQRYFGIPKTDTVTDTQVSPFYTNPAVVTVHERAVARAGIIDGDKAIICKFNPGMQT
jgi:hypothetical protein